MRTHGTLIKWNDDRGFGFISSAGGKEEIFVHVSAFPRGRRPQLNELISFETEVAPDGRRRAVRIMRPATQRTVPATSRGRIGRPGGMRFGGGMITALIAVAGLALYGYMHYRGALPPAVESTLVLPPPPPVESEAALPPPPPVASKGLLPTTPATSRFSCDGRTMCSQMTSCAEATFFIRNCSGTKMDGDNDRVPCESQWCK